jgi:hypothetical protein
MIALVISCGNTNVKSPDSGVFSSSFFILSLVSKCTLQQLVVTPFQSLFSSGGQANITPIKDKWGYNYVLYF